MFTMKLKDEHNGHEIELMNDFYEQVMKMLTPELLQACLVQDNLLLDHFPNEVMEGGEKVPPKESWIQYDEVSISASKLGTQWNGARLIDWTDDYIILLEVNYNKDKECFDYGEVIVCPHTCIRGWNRWCFSV